MAKFIFNFFIDVSARFTSNEIEEEIEAETLEEARKRLKERIARNGSDYYDMSDFEIDDLDIDFVNEELFIEEEKMIPVYYTDKDRVLPFKEKLEYVPSHYFEKDEEKE